MEDKVNHAKNECGKKTKQQITIPFQWEEAPGAPKKDWKPKPSCKPLTPVHLPVKYVASVPFKWEEKPGTPLRTFARDPTSPKNQEKDPGHKSLPLPPGYFTKYEDETEVESSYSDDNDDQDWLSEVEFDAISVKSEESICSPPLIAKTPQRNPYIEQQRNGYDLFKGPFSPERGKSAANYAAGNASLMGAEFLAHIFPLYPPKNGFLEQEKNLTEITRVPERKPTLLEEHQNFNRDGKLGGIIRRPCTLGELIMQSRRRSYRRKADNMRNHNQQKNFAKSKPQGCFDIKNGGGRLAKLLRKDFLALKLS